MIIVLLGIIVICCAAAVSNWRYGVYAAVFLDVLRDPIRKLTPGEPALMTQAMIPVWALILASCIAQQPSVLRELRKYFPRIKTGVILLFLAMIPGAFMSLLLYANGWMVAGIGGLSYVGPIAGLIVGACLATDPRSVLNFLRLYVVANSLTMIGSLAEYLRWDWPALGGMGSFEWIRHIPGVQVRMICGFFRSPDIAGFHAANVLIFCMLLTLPRFRGDRVRSGWLAVGFWAIYVITLAGRRKMLAIPIIFLFTFVSLNTLLHRRGAGKSIRFLLLAVVILSVGVTYGLSGNSDLDDHTEYFSTIIIDAAPKVYDSTFAASVNTLEQSGIMGSGLGIASQGAQYTGVDRSRVWQEDGTSRLFKELGVIGLMFLAGALICFAGDFRKALRARLADPSRSFLQVAGVAIAAGNLASFVISHQHISGDASNGLLPLIFLGGVLGHVIADHRARISAARQSVVLTKTMVVDPRRPTSKTL